MFNTRSKSYIDLYSWRRFYAKTSDWMIRILNRCFFFRSFILNSVFFLQVSCSLRMKCLHKNRKYAQIETILQGHLYDLKILKAWNGSIIALHYYIAHYEHGAAGKKFHYRFSISSWIRIFLR